MRAAGSLLPVAVIAVAASLAACSGDPKATTPRPPPPASALVGSYQCLQFLGYYKGSSGTGWYRGSCPAYINATNPSRRDSIEVQAFDVNTRFEVNRPDFETGTFVYDSARAIANINYASDRTPETYDVWLEGVNLLTRRFYPFDYTGDGVLDSLIITYRKIP